MCFQVVPAPVRIIRQQAPQQVVQVVERFAQSPRIRRVRLFSPFFSLIIIWLSVIIRLPFRVLSLDISVTLAKE